MAPSVSLGSKFLVGQWLGAARSGRDLCVTDDFLHQKHRADQWGKKARRCWGTGLNLILDRNYNTVSSCAHERITQRRSQRDTTRLRQALILNPFRGDCSRFRRKLCSVNQREKEKLDRAPRVPRGSTPSERPSDSPRP